MTDEIARAPADEVFTPVADRWTQPFWDAAKRHVLTAAKCAECGAFRMPPTPFCPHCLSQDIEWPELSGRGAIHSFTIVRRAAVPALEATLPYVPALIELPDAPGVRLVSNIVGVRLGDIAIGREARVMWRDRRDRVSVPCFTF